MATSPAQGIVSPNKTIDFVVLGSSLRSVITCTVKTTIIEAMVEGQNIHFRAVFITRSTVET